MATRGNSVRVLVVREGKRRTTGEEERRKTTMSTHAQEHEGLGKALTGRTRDSINKHLSLARQQRKLYASALKHVQSIHPYPEQAICYFCSAFSHSKD